MSSRPPDLSDGALNAFADATGVAVVISSAHGIRFANRTFLRATRFRLEDVVGKRLVSLVDPEARGRLEMQIERQFQERQLEQREDVPLLAKDGQIIQAEHISSTIEEGGTLLIVSTFVERSNGRDEVPARQARQHSYRELFEDDATGRVIATPDWRIVDCNVAMAQMLGHESAAQLVGRRLSEFTSDAMVLQRSLAVMGADGRSAPVEVQFDRVDGEPVRATCSVVGTFNEAGTLTALRAQLIEVTDSRRLQMRLEGSQRMEGIGRLAGGVAHDFNNLLMVISGHSDRLMDKLPPGDSLRTSAQAIQEASARAASLTRQLLAFGRRQVFELRAVAVHRLIRDAEPLITKVVGASISLRLEVPAELPNIKADATQLEHVIVNLALNAREAMAGGGTLSIRVDATEIERAPRDRVWLRPGRYVRVVVADTGPGMDPVTKAHVFQPFFTTKQVGSGSGLGLATVYGIVKQSNGFVWVDSEVGHGAAFTMLFPVAPSERLRPTSETRGTVAETILVVESDDRVRTFVADALRRRGYQVLDASSSQRALEAVAAQMSPVHLLVCEVGSAVDDAPLYARLKELEPTIQVLFVLDRTGGAASGNAPPGMPTIQKPFTLHALADKVRAVLDSGEGRG